MKKTLTFLVFICLFHVQATAQDATPYKIALQKMMTASGSENTYKVVIDQMIGMLKKQHTTIPTAYWEKMTAKFSKSSMTDLLELLTPIYQKHLTLADISALTAFYETPVGKKFAEKTPLLMQESMQAGQQWGTKIAQEMLEEIKTKAN